MKKMLFLLFAISSFGMDIAMAQNEVGNGVPAPLARQTDHRTDARDNHAGSDVRPSGHVLPFNGDYTTLANPG